MTYKQKAIDYFLEGYNCAQAVMLAFHEEIGLDKETALKLTSSFGGGMGGLREVCGAASGMFMVVGLMQGYTGAKDQAGKQAHYATIQRLAAQFQEAQGSIICRDLLGAIEASRSTPHARTESYYKTRPCAVFVGYAAEIAAQELGFGEKA